MFYQIKTFIQAHRLLVILSTIALLAACLAIAFMVTRNSVDKNNTTNTPDVGSQQNNNSSEQNNDPAKPDDANKDSNKQAPDTTKPSDNSTNSSNPSQDDTSSPQPDPGNNDSAGPQKNCIIKPRACGYPDATNTGYKHTGVTLTTNGININPDGDFIIDQDNTVIDSKRIDGCVIIRAKNVTIKRSLITNCQAFYNIWLQELPGGGIRDTSNFLMEDVEVDGNQVFTNAAIVDDNGKGLVIRRMDMHDVADGPHPGENWLIEDSYIHDMYVCPNDCHTDSIQSAGAINVTIRHNTIRNNPENSGTGGKNAVIRIATEQSPVNGFVVDNNLLDGGNYAIQVREQGNGAPTGVVITNNRIVPTWRFAPYDFTDIPIILSGNIRDDNLASLNISM